MGEALRPGNAVLLAALAAAAAAVLADAAGFPVRPQVRFQVPERWRRTMPLRRAVLLYGFVLGTGVATYVPAAAGWALLGLSFALGSWAYALAIGLSFAAGRALPVLVLASRGAEAVAERPQGLRIVRAFAALSLAAGAAASLAGPGSAAILVASRAGDPSTAGGDLVWQRPRVGGFLRRDGVVTRLPGSDPAVSGSLIAWHSGSEITVADRKTQEPALQVSVRGVEKLALSDEWLVYRKRVGGYARIFAQDVIDPARKTAVSAPRPAGQLGRPSIDVNLVVFHVATRDGSWIRSVDLASGEKRRLRFSRTVQYLNPSVLRSRLLYVRVSRCAQELRAAPRRPGRRGRTLYTLPPLAGQDLGHQRGHPKQGRHLPCSPHPHATARMLWTTALASHFAYVTVLRPSRSGRMRPTLLRMSR